MPVLGVAPRPVAPRVAADVCVPDFCLVQAVSKPISASNHGAVPVAGMFSNILRGEGVPKESTVKSSKALAGKGPRATQGGSGMVVDARREADHILAPIRAMLASSVRELLEKAPPADFCDEAREGGRSGFSKQAFISRIRGSDFNVSCANE